jgi:hypothetical protein
MSKKNNTTTANSNREQEKKKEKIMKQSSEKKERKKHQQHQQKNCRPDGNCNNIIVPSIYLYIVHISTTVAVAAKEEKKFERPFFSHIHILK